MDISDEELDELFEHISVDKTDKRILMLKEQYAALQEKAERLESVLKNISLDIQGFEDESAPMELYDRLLSIKEELERLDGTNAIDFKRD